MNTLDLVAGIQLFNGLPREQLEEIAKVAVDKTFPKGQTVFSDGEEAAGFYVVVSGRVKTFGRRKGANTAFCFSR
jgi:CRP/FNR family transcriptional regulator